MVNPKFISYKIEDKSYVSYIKREVHRLISPYFSEQKSGEIDIVVAELTSNIVKYAGEGELLYRINFEDSYPVFEMICIDNGPGIRNVSHFTKDGVSSSTSLGHGIGSVMRLSNSAQFYSINEWGTIVYTRFMAEQHSKETKKKLLVRCLNLSKPGETVAGDGYSVKVDSNRTFILVGDGLGHGQNAHEAVNVAIDAFNSTDARDPASMIREIDKVVRKTRGLVATVAVFDDSKHTWEICGVGNISTRLYQGLEYKNYVCNNGIIGMNIPNRLDNAILPMEKFQQLILCSDGIRTKWDLIRYPAILKYDPMILAAAIYKDHARQTDDMTILIAKVS